MSEREAARRLVKSLPELWAACSDPSTLGRHLQAFGEIKITRLEPETTVAWEGESVRGTVVLEPSGWGTKVTLTAVGEPKAETPVAEVETAPVVVSEPAPVAEPEVLVEERPAPEPVAVAPRPGFFARLMGRGSVPAAPAPAPVMPEPVAVIEPEPEPELVVTPAAEPAAVVEPAPAPVVDALAALEAALDSLGQAHHRPYSLT
jgi:hypothetical protein